MERDNKYYEIIENLVKQHKKFNGYEAILDDIIEDVIKHSEVIINSIDNESVIIPYLEKVVSTSIITVPKKLNFHNELKHSVISPNIQPLVQEQTNDKSVNDDIFNEISIEERSSDININAINSESNELITEPIEETINITESEENLSAEIPSDFSDNIQETEPYNEIIDDSDSEDIKVNTELVDKMINLAAAQDELNLAEEIESESEENPVTDETIEENNIEESDYEENFVDELETEELDNNIEYEPQLELSDDSNISFEEADMMLTNISELQLSEEPINNIVEDDINNIEYNSSEEIQEEANNEEVNTDGAVLENTDEVILEDENAQENTLETDDTEINFDLQEVNTDFANFDADNISFIDTSSEETETLDTPGNLSDELELQEFSDSELTEQFNSDILTSDDNINIENSEQLEFSDNFAIDEVSEVSNLENNFNTDFNDSVESESFETELDSTSNEISNFYEQIDNANYILDDNINTNNILNTVSNISSEYPSLNILEVFNLRYGKNLKISEIANSLNTDEANIIEALNKLSEAI